MEDQKGREAFLAKRRKHYAEHKELYKGYHAKYKQNLKLRQAKKDAINS